MLTIFYQCTVIHINIIWYLLNCREGYKMFLAGTVVGHNYEYDLCGMNSRSTACARLACHSIEFNRFRNHLTWLQNGRQNKMKRGEIYERTLFLLGICLCRGHTRIRNGKNLTVKGKWQYIFYFLIWKNIEDYI
jgi:hypothetical protein